MMATKTEKWYLEEHLEKWNEEKIKGKVLWNKCLVMYDPKDVQNTIRFYLRQDIAIHRQKIEVISCDENECKIKLFSGDSFPIVEISIDLVNKAITTLDEEEVMRYVRNNSKQQEVRKDDSTVESILCTI